MEDTEAERRKCENRGTENADLFPNRLGGLGERRELSSGVRGGAPAANAFLAYEAHRILLVRENTRNLNE